MVLSGRRRVLGNGILGRTPYPTGPRGAGTELPA